MLKCIGILSVVFSSVGFGVVSYERMKRREQELTDFHRVLVYLQDSLECLQCGLRDSFSGAVSLCESALKAVLDEFLVLLNEDTGMRASLAWETALKSVPLSFDAKDTMVLKNFGKGLDGHSFASQKRNIVMAITETEKQLDEAREQRSKNGKLTLKLGVFCGIGAVLLLI